MQALCLSGWGREARMEVVAPAGLGIEVGIMGPQVMHEGLRGQDSC